MLFRALDLPACWSALIGRALSTAELAGQYHCFGYLGLRILLHNEGRVLGRKRICRLYEEEGVFIRRA
jgi:hypothetical protein